MDFWTHFRRGRVNDLIFTFHGVLRSYPARRDGLRETCARKRLHSQAARNNATRTKRAVAASTTRLSGWRESMASNCGASNECQSEELDNSPRD